MGYFIKMFMPCLYSRTYLASIGQRLQLEALDIATAATVVVLILHQVWLLIVTIAVSVVMRRRGKQRNREVKIEKEK